LAFTDAERAKEEKAIKDMNAIVGRLHPLLKAHDLLKGWTIEMHPALSIDAEVDPNSIHGPGDPAYIRVTRQGTKLPEVQAVVTQVIEDMGGKLKKQRRNAFEITIAGKELGVQVMRGFFTLGPQWGDYGL